jgi:hypothetical protein
LWFLFYLEDSISYSNISLLHCVGGRGGTVVVCLGVYMVAGGVVEYGEMRVFDEEEC